MTGARLAGILRSRWTRAAFLVVALGAAAWVVWGQREAVATAADRLEVVHVLVAVVAALVYGPVTAFAWRSLLVDGGAPVRTGVVLRVFLVGQIGKYLPGGLWNVVASAELGRDAGLSRLLVATTLTITLLVGVASGAALGLASLVVGGTLPTWLLATVVCTLAVVLVALAPPVLARLVRAGLRLARREPLERETSSGALLRALLWSLLAWAVAGVQVTALAVGLGAPLGWRTVALCTGGFALAWVAGFVVVLAPAGVGVREVVLAGMLAGVLPPGELVLLVVLTRLCSTLAEVVLALALLRGRPSGAATAA